ncbi:MAG: spore germination protein GerW family protein [Bacteroidota bacterium]
MEVKIEDLLDKVSGHVKDISGTKTVLGDEFTLGEYTCRPVIKVATGFGSGSGTGDDPKKKACGSGTGVGAGIAVVPAGFLVAKGDQISFIGADRKSSLSSLFEKIPDLVERVAEMKNKEAADASEPGEEKKEKKS